MLTGERTLQATEASVSQHRRHPPMAGQQLVEQVPGRPNLMVAGAHHPGSDRQTQIVDRYDPLRSRYLACDSWKSRPARPPLTTCVSTITIDGSGSRLC